MRNLIYSLPIFLLMIWGCSDLPPFNGKKDLPGSWHCKTIEIVSPENESISISAYKYGYAYFELSKDNQFYYNFEIIKDVVIEKSVFGNPYKKTLLQGGYKNIRKGRYSAGDSTISFFDQNNNLINSETYSFSDRKLITSYKDKENKTWKFCWERE